MLHRLKSRWERKRHERALNLGRSPGDKLKRRYRFFQIGFFVLLLGYGFVAWGHYDYWVFRLLIASNYIFTDDLDELYSRHLQEENRRGFHRDFDRVMISVFTEAIREVNQDRYTYLYSPQAHIAVREREEHVGRQAAVTRLTDDTVHVWVPNISRWSRDFVVSNQNYLAQYSNLILDLRNNPGGMLRDFHRIANLFVPRGAVLGHEETRIPFLTRTVTSRGQPSLDFDQIIILQNGRTASAAEGLIQALVYHVPRVTTLGEPTFGKGIGQVTIPLTRGYAVRASVLLVSGPDGENIHRTGVAPHIPGDAYLDWVEQALLKLYN
ncbi:MAG: S41 family peptidase [Defluviitaleaceae bacterium]|nr:S41 family peptidase [Defluviitaleaceae bacterium]MCL2238902.1 S41 family peptidase [Defluviitaleaceae bacterium]MCL2239422.1 S41 family peptidase [Defluviitaleaceae bacterium]